MRLGDIAHALARQCRFNGHVFETYSVAQHAVIVALEVWRRTGDPELALWGLHHDDEEAYLGDIVAPLKRWVQSGLSDGERAELSLLLEDDERASSTLVYKALTRLVEGVLDRYRVVAAETQAAICAHFGLPTEEPAIVKEVDKLLLRVEQHHLQPPFADGSDSERHASKPPEIAHITLHPHTVAVPVTGRRPAQFTHLLRRVAARSQGGLEPKLWLSCWDAPDAEAEFVAAHHALTELRVDCS